VTRFQTGIPKIKEWDVGVSGIDAMVAEAAKVPDCIKLEIGEPDLPTPARAVDAARKAIDDRLVKYTPSIGLEELRKAYCRKLAKEDGITNVTPENVAITSGAMQGLFYTMLATLKPHDEVLIPDPAYPQYEQQARLIGAVPVSVPTRIDDGFRLNASEIIERITPKTRLLVINYPTNPTGVTYSKSELADIIKVCEERDLWIVSDEVYERIVFGHTKHTSIRTLAKDCDQVVTVFSFSKTYAMTGWRLGASVASEKIIQRFSVIADNDINCPSAVAQYAGLAALECDREVEEMRKTYEKRTMLAYDLLRENKNIDILKPEGAFYVFPRIDGIKSSLDFCMRLLKEKKVATVPGSAFGKCGEGFVRISCANSEENIIEGITRFNKLVNETAVR